jgi:hypothetical protein
VQDSAKSVSSAGAAAQGAGDALHDVGADAARGVGAGDAAGVRVLALAGGGALDEGVAGAAAARVEAADAGAGSGGDGLSGNAGSGSGLRGAEEVASAAAAGVREGVLRDGGVRLVDGEARHRGVSGWWW